ncbi:DNA primase [Alicyclobacillaceae bacterium I2511]|nr:DNA primase [Alicyclobacillaceae bacterium I2511]
MVQIPDEFVEEVRHRNDIVDVVSDYVQLRRSGRSFVGLCPFHNERTPSFSVSPERQLYHCFGCGAGGTVIRFVMDVEGMPFGEAVMHLAERAGIALPEALVQQVDSPRRQGQEQILMVHELATKLYSYILMNTGVGVQALTYLEARGVSRQTMHEFRLGFAPADGTTMVRFLSRRGYVKSIQVESGIAVEVGGQVLDRFRDRVIIPIADVQGRVISFAGRTLKPTGMPKYLNSPETAVFHKGRMLFNFHQARKHIRQSHRATLFEGYMDVISAWQAGVKEAVASMGTAFSADHARLLKRDGARLVIAYDGDEAGFQATRRAIEIAREANLDMAIVSFPEGQDPDDYVKSHGEQALRRRLSNELLSEVQFLLELEHREANLQTTVGRTDFLRRALEIIGNRATPVEQETRLQELAAELHVSLEALKDELRSIHPRGGNKSRKLERSYLPGAGSLGRLPPAAEVAGERILLAMLTDERSFQYMCQQGLDELATADQTELLALIYNFRAEHPTASAELFLDTLEDPALVGLAAKLLSAEVSKSWDSPALEDYLRAIRLHSLEAIYEQMVRSMILAQTDGRLEEVSTLRETIAKLQQEIAQLKTSSGKGKAGIGVKEAGLK